MRRNEENNGRLFGFYGESLGSSVHHPVPTVLMSTAREKEQNNNKITERKCLLRVKLSRLADNFLNGEGTHECTLNDLKCGSMTRL